ncbi:MAG: phytanoyl-CoA dioxygenase family protein [Armatimonadetes bacterium]|jgi:hypothetical protein|nr:phytanoyl-CoA dioxygenase family protein [Armatimonadota bacterium]
MKVMMGERELELGGRYLGTLRDATDLRHDVEALHARLEEEGYLLIRGFHDPARVREARRVVVENLAANGQIDKSRPLDEAVIAPGGRGLFLGGSRAVTRTPEFQGLVESPELFGFFERLLGGPVTTFSHKWLRAVGQGQNTGAHLDIVYMGRGTDRLYTVWTPLGDISYEMGPLAVFAGSHRLRRVKETYGRLDVDRDEVAQGWFSNDPVELVERYGGRWLSAEFAMGDAMIFGMYLMHGSLNNSTGRFRLSCDTRYQRADELLDDRWVGENPKGHTERNPADLISMAEARLRWGV